MAFEIVEERNERERMLISNSNDSKGSRLKQKKSYKNYK